MVKNANECFKNIFNELRPCLNADEINFVKNIQDSTTSLLSFLCNRDRAQIKRFINSNGTECVRSNKHKFGKCYESKFEKYFDINMRNSKDEINFCK